MSRLPSLVLAVTLLILPQTAIVAAQEEPPSSGEMVVAARNFLASLTHEQRQAVSFPFDSDVRFDWHYIPKRSRKGLAFKAMTSEQVHLAHVLLNTGLSPRGFSKTVTVMSLESLVREMEESAGRTLMLQLRDPNLYYFSVFGDPALDSDWGWSVEGHHVSLNFTLVDKKGVATTPAFLGAEPHEVRTGARRGLRVLGREEDLARDLLDSLDDEQRRVAIVSDQAPRDIYTSASRQVELEASPAGLRAAAMGRQQKEVLRNLIEEYLLSFPPDLAAARRKKVEEGGFEEIVFAWRGSTANAAGEAHYYRIQGPQFLIEYDNIQNEANHSHTVWRDYDGDFGRDLLAEHHGRDHSH